MSRKRDLSHVVRSRGFTVTVFRVFSGLVILLSALWIGACYWQQHVRDVAAAQIESIGGAVRWRPYGPRWLGLRTPSEVLLGDCQRASADECALLWRFPDVEKVDLFRSRVGDDWLQPIGRMKALRFLGASGTDIGDRGLAYIDQCKSLEVLRLARTRVHGPGLIHLGGLRRLRDLNLEGCAIDAASIPHLRALPSLRRLWLSSNQLTDGSLEIISQIVTLEHLSVFDGDVSHEGIGHLSRLPRLTSLSLSGARITDECLPVIEKMKSLRDLGLYDTAITPKGAEELRRKRPDIYIEGL